MNNIELSVLNTVTSKNIKNNSKSVAVNSFIEILSDVVNANDNGENFSKTSIDNRVDELIDKKEKNNTLLFQLPNDTSFFLSNNSIKNDLLKDFENDTGEPSIEKNIILEVEEINFNLISEDGDNNSSKEIEKDNSIIFYENAKESESDFDIISNEIDLNREYLDDSTYEIEPNTSGIQLLEDNNDINTHDMNIYFDSKYNLSDNSIDYVEYVIRSDFFYKNIIADITSADFNMSTGEQYSNPFIDMNNTDGNMDNFNKVTVLLNEHKLFPNVTNSFDNMSSDDLMDLKLSIRDTFFSINDLASKLRDINSQLVESKSDKFISNLENEISDQQFTTSDITVDSRDTENNSSYLDLNEMRSPDRLNDIFSRFSSMVSNSMAKGSKKLTIQLNPSSLGKIELSIAESKSGLTAKLFFESETSKQVFINNYDVIKDSLEEKGVILESMDFLSKNSGFSKKNKDKDKGNDKTLKAIAFDTNNKKEASEINIRSGLYA